MEDQDQRQEAGSVTFRNSVIALGVVVILLAIGGSCAFCRGGNKPQAQFESTLKQGMDNYKEVKKLISEETSEIEKEIETRAASAFGTFKAKYEGDQLAEQRKREARRMDALDEATIAALRGLTASAPVTASACEQYRGEGARYRACLTLPPPRR